MVSVSQGIPSVLKSHFFGKYFFKNEGYYCWTHLAHENDQAFAGKHCEKFEYI